ncbi:hypothetical protein [Enterococcus casseliflavus]|uniref:hypothetical protein n=1 Tax=Enterococcus casseliflavus TaxID=37734 RepID=UPI003D105999
MLRVVGFIPLSLLDVTDKNSIKIDNETELVGLSDISSINKYMNLVRDKYYFKQFIEDIEEKKYPYLIYKKSFFGKNIKNTNTNGLLVSIHNLNIIILFGLWLVKDNAINMITSVGIFQDESQKMLSYNNKDSKFSDSKGLYSKTTFSIQEFETCFKYIGMFDDEFFITKINQEEYDKRHNEGYISSSIFNFNDLDRIQKCVLFINEARKSTFIPTKIASYASGFEALISSSKEQITVNIAERISIFLSEDYEERIAIFKNVKNIYNARSYYIHGSDYGKKLSRDLEGLSVEADSIMRRLMLLFIENKKFNNLKNMSDQEFDDWYRKEYTFR